MLLATFSIAQQERANRWVFPNFNGLDFSSGSPQTVTDSLFGSRGTAAISDLNGDLIFYSNGATVWQANGAVMQNGSGLVGTTQATQACLITPSAISPSRYYLFTNDDLGGPDGFQYYDVEMSLNGGNGGVIGPTMLLDSATEKMAATKHANDRDYWVVAHKTFSDEFHAFLIDENGVNSTPVISATGIVHSTSTGGSGEFTGQMKISPNGKWLATCNFGSGYVQLFPFDNATGTVGDPITLASFSTNRPYGVEFSADSRKIYYSRSYSSASDPADVRQFDLEHVSVDCLLASEETFSNNNPFKLYTDLQLGIDKRIYINYYIPSFSVDTIGAILNPEEKYPDCEYVDEHLPLNHGMIIGLTNFVSSFVSDGIRVEFGSNCDQDTTWFLPEDTLGVDSVRWNFGDPTSGSNTSTLTSAPHVFSSPDTFLVTLFSFTGNNTDTFTRNVIIWDTAVDLLGNDTTLCENQSITLDATWYDACYLWSDSSTNTTFTTNQGGWHWVDVFHQSCTWRDSVFVTVVDDVPQFSLGNDTAVCSDVNFVIDPDLQDAFYTWQDGSHDTTFTVTSTGTYWLEASNACGSSSDTLNVILNEAAQPVLEFPDDTTACDTVGLFLDVTFEDAVYEWNDGITTATRLIEEPGTYWVRVGNVCDTVSDTIEVFLDDPIIPILPEREVFCGPGDELVFLGTADSMIVDWSDGSSSDSINIQSPGTYSLVGENTCGFATDTIRILEWDTSYLLDIGNDTTICPTDTAVLLGDDRDDYPWTYLWNTGSTQATIFAFEGTYILRASHRCNDQEHRVRVSQSSLPFIEDPTALNVCQGETLAFELNTDQLEQIEWSTGDSTSSIVVTTPGFYEVSTVDSAGCTSYDSITIGGICPGLVNAFNVFTPNGDGQNDELCAEFRNIVSFSIAIHNRWGTEVFYSEDETKCWDGQINGREAAEGVYYYIIEAEDTTGERYSYRGSLTLLR